MSQNQPVFQIRTKYNEKDTTNEYCILKRTISKDNNVKLTGKDDDKYFFHFKTSCKFENDGEVIIDDSELFHRPMELVIGRKFRMEYLETALLSMELNEISDFKLHPVHSINYIQMIGPIRTFLQYGHDVPKDVSRKLPTTKCCASAFQTKNKEEKSSLNDQEKIDERIKEEMPSLTIRLKLVKVEKEGKYEKHVMFLETQDKMQKIIELKEEGNEKFKEKNFPLSIKSYETALNLLQQLRVNEKPGTEEFFTLQLKEIPFYNNLSQSHVNLENYYAAISFAEQVLAIDRFNIKALYRLILSNIHIGRFDEAMESIKIYKKILISQQLFPPKLDENDQFFHSINVDDVHLKPTINKLHEQPKIEKSKADSCIKSLQYLCNLFQNEKSLQDEMDKKRYSKIFK
ncbi:hypothetical protein SNEBB_004193 [Seison nebaliae]|nr:hypothetical protein SNEBB_004193 [Seison nebaliae]